MDLVMTIENNLDSNLCKEIIEKYEADKRKYPGTTGGGYIPEMKTSSDLMISRFSDWESIEDKLDDMLRLNIKEYQKFKIPEIAQSVPNILPDIVMGVTSPYPTAI
jgi:hypothetical protein